MSYEKQLKDIETALAGTLAQLQAYHDESKKQITKNGELSAETKSGLDKVLAEHNALNARLRDIEKALESNQVPEGPAARTSFGQQFMANASKFGHLVNQKSRVNFEVQNVITSTTNPIVREERLPGVIFPGLRRLTIMDLLPMGRTDSEVVQYVREVSFTNSAAPVAQNPTLGKPESDWVSELVNANVATIAHWIPVSRQMLADVAGLQSMLDQRMIYGLEIATEQQLLNGDGTGLNVDGLNNQAVAYAAPAGATVVGEQSIDRLRLAMLQVALSEYSADGIVLNPVDWANIQLTKDSENRYIYGNPNTAIDTNTNLWGVRVVPTTAQPVGDFLVGAFQLGAQVFERETINVTMSTEDRDNFIKNMVTILAERRLALTVYRPEAFVTGDFTFAP